MKPINYLQAWPKLQGKGENVACYPIFGFLIQLTALMKKDNMGTHMYIPKTSAELAFTNCF